MKLKCEHERWFVNVWAIDPIDGHEMKERVKSCNLIRRQITTECLSCLYYKEKVEVEK